MEGRREPKVLSRSALIQYQHECVVSSLTLVHRGYRDRDLKPDTAIMLQFDLKNIGTVTPIRLLGSGGIYDPNRNQNRNQRN